MSATQINSEVKFKTPLGPDVLLFRDMSMTEELGRLFTIDLNLLSEQGDITFEDVLAQNVTIELKLASGDKRFFNGFVTRFSQTGDEGNYAVYQATVKPWFWFLTRTADCRIFQEMSVPDIVKEVFRKLGYTDFKDKLTKNYRTWDYCVQYRETDFNFVSRLLEQEGIYYYFTHDDGVHNLVLSDGEAAHKALPSDSVIDYYPPDSTAVRKKDHIFNWNITKQVQPGKYELNEFDFEKPKAQLETKSEIVRKHAIADYEIYDYPGEYTKTDDGERYVQARIEELHCQYEQARGQSGVRELTTGYKFKLKGYPRDDQNREYLITSATHSIHSHVYGTAGMDRGDPYSNSFSVIESKTPYRSSRITPKPIVQGTQTAIVVGPSDEEIYTDKYGRVKIQFHWDRYGVKDENSSCWVRVAQIWAGKRWGGIHIPRIGQEVIVDFMEGDPDRPIITGRVYNADQMPPYDLPENKTQSGIKSRSSKSGTKKNFNEIRMEDKKGNEQLYIHAEKNQSNIVENDETTSVGHDRTETVGNNETITIKANRTEIVGAGDKGGDETITIIGDRTETVGAGKKGGNENITIKGDRTEKVSGDEIIGITGDRTENVGTKKASADETLTVFGDRTRTVKNDETINIGEVLSITAGETISLSVGESLLIMKKDGTITLSGKTITITGSDEVKMGVGSQNVTCNKQKVETSGVAINSSAVGMHEITGAVVKIN